MDFSIMEFGDRVKYLRLQRGLTLDALAKILHVSNATVSRWETGKIENVRTDKLLPLSEALGTSVAFLIGASDDTDPNKFTSLALALALQTNEKTEILDQAESIKDRMSIAIEKAQRALIEKAMEICKDSAKLDKAQQLRELELMPARIGLVTDFIERNSDFLKKNMPGMTPSTPSASKE